MFERLKNLFRAPAPPPEPGEVPAGKEAFCGKCGLRMKLGEVVDRSGYNRASGEKWVEFHVVWACPAWADSYPGYNHDSSTIGGTQRRAA